MSTSGPSGPLVDSRIVYLPEISRQIYLDVDPDQIAPKDQVCCVCQLDHIKWALTREKTIS